MKKLLIILLSAFVLVSCDKVSTKKVETKLPVEVVKLASAHQFDTLIVIQTEKEIYIYKDSQYKETVNLWSDEITAALVGAAFLMVVIIVILLFISLYD